MNPLSQADAEQSVALVAVKKLLSSSHKDAANAAENGKFNIDFQITFDRAATQTNVRVVSRSCKSISEVIQTADPRSLPADHAVMSGVVGIPQTVGIARPSMNAADSASPSVPWISEVQLAKHLDISTRHLINLRKSGLPYIQLGATVRYNLEEVEHYLRGNRRLSAHIERQKRKATLRGS